MAAVLAAEIIKMPQRNKNIHQSGFTLIELLVVIAIIAILSSVVMIGLVSARQKSRNVKRLADMTQMNTALELFNAQNKGYPDADANGVPVGMTPTFLTTMPVSPTPADGYCGEVQNPLNQPANPYYYVPTGTSAVVNGITIYPDYIYYFCLGDQTGNFAAGIRTLTPKGVR